MGNSTSAPAAAAPKVDLEHSESIRQLRRRHKQEIYKVKKQAEINQEWLKKDASQAREDTMMVAAISGSLVIASLGFGIWSRRGFASQRKILTEVRTKATEQQARQLVEIEGMQTRAAADAKKQMLFANQSFAKSLLDVADNLDRALTAVPSGSLKDNEEFTSFVEGITLTEKELLGAFETHGVEKLQPYNQLFDPNFHEAVMQLQDLEKPHNVVCEVLQSGYTIHDRIIRPARVGVNQNPGVPAATAESNAGEATEEAADEPQKKEE